MNSVDQDIQRVAFEPTVQIIVRNVTLIAVDAFFFANEMKPLYVSHQESYQQRYVLAGPNPCQKLRSVTSALNSQDNLHLSPSNLSLGTSGSDAIGTSPGFLSQSPNFTKCAQQYALLNVSIFPPISPNTTYCFSACSERSL